MTDDRDPYRDWDAAYVLGSLSPEDRRAFERHLATCPECAAAVAELAGMPGLLGTLGRDDAIALLSEPDDEHLRAEQHGPGLVQRLAASARRNRRRARRWRVGLSAAAAVLVLAGGVLIGTRIAAPGATVAEPPATSAPPSTAVAMTPLRSGTMTAELQLTEKAWGTRLDWSCEYLNPGWKDDGETPGYDLVVTDASGAETTVASWSAAGSKASGLTASSSVQTSDIRSVEIRLSSSGTALVRTDL